MAELRFIQLYDSKSSTFTYILADGKTGDGLIIDPVREKVDFYVQQAKNREIKLLFALDTHVHADHITGSGTLRELVGAKVVMGKATGVDCADILLDDGEAITFGEHTLKAISTPGHTSGCTTFQVEDKIFTGDALMINKVGRTDFQEGDARALYKSVTEKLFTLPDATQVYPAHDYEGNTFTTIGMQKKNNLRLAGKSEDEFVEIMENLNLPMPEQLEEAVPANMKCGRD